VDVKPVRMRHPDRRELVWSTQRCLDELCGNFNVTNEWLFVDDHKRRRRNPCYGRNPTSFDGQ